MRDALSDDDEPGIVGVGVVDEEAVTRWSLVSRASGREVLGTISMLLRT